MNIGETHFVHLLPEIYHYNYNQQEILDNLDEHVACVVVEIIQAEAGIKTPDTKWLQALHKKCKEKGVLFIADEIQSGFGRTGTLWAFEQFNIVPDILLLGKALGGGMPLGAFIADKNLMATLTHQPVLGHITTFGGHPVSCAAGKAAFEELINNHYIKSIQQKQDFVLKKLSSKHIQNIFYHGLWFAIQFNNTETAHAIIKKCIDKGLITDWFIFAPDCLRLAPPLIIDEEALNTVCEIILNSINEVCN
jgi:acetylornithine/N-succinyldiaminopimelate aminotransferase